MTDPPPLAQLSEAERAVAMRRYEVLRPQVENGVPLARAAAAAGVPQRTAARWLARYRADGVAGLARAPRLDRGHRRLPPELVALVEGLALRRPRPSAAQVHRQVGEVAAVRGWPAPSYPWVYRVVRGLEPGLVTLAHDGPKVYRETFDLLHRHEAAAPNETWQADHCLLDVWVPTPSGRPAKPWLTAVLDDHSRAVAGYTVHLEAPSALQTALALRQAVWHKPDAGWRVCGLPDVFYTDHGSDFTSRHLEQVAADLQFRLVFSIPGRPRGRGKIERFFRTVAEMCLAALPGYDPPGHRHYAEASPAPAMTLTELDQALHAFVLRYQARRHSETAQPPQARWEAGGFLPRLPDSLEQLDLLLFTVARPRKIRADGIRFQGLRYLDLGLAAYVGEDVVIRYDPRDVSEIRIFHAGRFLCKAVSVDLPGASISLKDITAARNARRRQLTDDLAGRESLVDRLLQLQAAKPLPAPHPAPAPAADARPKLKLYREE